MNKFATYVMVFDYGEGSHQAKWVMRNLENAYSHVDRIYVMYAKLPWGYNPDARKIYENKFDLNIIKQSKYIDKISIIEGDWMSDTEQRNYCLNRAKQDGFDYLMVHDADEFYFHDDFEKIRKIVEEEETYEVFEIALYAFWKSFKYILIDPQRGKVGGINQTIVNLSRVDHYDYIRDVHTVNRLLIPDVICYHGSYVLTDEEVYNKIKIWSHNNDFDVDKWYNEVWLSWTLESKNLHPIWSWCWDHCEIFNDKLPEVIQDLI
jgi:hypothetical protein